MKNTSLSVSLLECDREKKKKKTHPFFPPVEYARRQTHDAMVMGKALTWPALGEFCCAGSSRYDRSSGSRRSLLYGFASGLEF